MRRKNETTEEYRARFLQYQKNIQSKRKPIAKKTQLKRKGRTSSAKAKERIQTLIRKRAIERDGGCVLRHYPEAGRCGPIKESGEPVLQAEHLNNRAHSISYADMDNIVCLCSSHHLFFKKREPFLYWLLIRTHIGEKRWAKVEEWTKDRSPHRMFAADWLRLEESLTK